MSRLIIIIVVVLVAIVQSHNTNLTDYCDGFETNFNLKKIIGSWYVVAIIPEKDFPANQEQITCYRVEFSETDVAGLRWLINKTFESPSRKELMNRIQGIIVRQRYHTVPPFDVWSRSINENKGCFQQVLALDTDKSDINKALTHEALMQLHLMETAESGPLLLQILWGRMISAVIYRRKQGIIFDHLPPVSEIMNKLRGPHLRPRLCDKTLKDLLGLKF